VRPDTVALDLVLASFVFAFFALVAAFVYLLSSRSELSMGGRPERFG
jgi:hypothetical protein